MLAWAQAAPVAASVPRTRPAGLPVLADLAPRDVMTAQWDEPAKALGERLAAAVASMADDHDHRGSSGRAMARAARQPGSQVTLRLTCATTNIQLSTERQQEAVTT